MRDGADEAIDRVMEGMRGVEVPAGMEGRVLRAMEEARERRTGWVWGPVPVRAMACAALLLVVGAVLVSPRAHRRRGVDVRAAVPAVVVERASGDMAAVAAPVTVQPVRREGRRSAGMAKESLAMWETRAPSLVAPPMPLTEEEVLLVRTMHRGDPEEIAMLRPEVRAARDAEGSAEFEAFFNPAQTGDKE